MKNLLSLVALVVAVGALAVSLLGGGTSPLGGLTNLDELDVSDGYRVDNVMVINGSGVVSASIASTGTLALNGGTAFRQTASGTASFSQVVLGPLGSSTSTASTTISFSVSGLAVGDPCYAGLTSATSPGSGLVVSCYVHTAVAGNATGTVSVTNLQSIDKTIATGTYRAIIFR